ncbi:MAG TPA: PQQ-binding-like beta-propeller repeat protein [Gemmataceae bacterium]|nr:PQQ-binding-like beta-propeller repeat protein [Gemmataceae bacterium]
MHQRCPWYVSLALAAAVLAAHDGPTSRAEDWPQWRGPHRDGISTETGLLKHWPASGPQLLWTAKNVGRGYSSIAVAKGKIYTISDRKKDCIVLALDASNGKELWATRIASAQGDGPRCTPTVDGERVYALSRQGELACLDTGSGAVRWRKSYKKELGGRMMSTWDYSESPLVDGDKLICTPGGDKAALVALNKLTGEVLWKAPVSNAGGAGYSSVVVTEVGGVRQYITLLGSGIVGVDANNGRLLWRYTKIANGTANIPTPIVHNDLVFCSTGYNAGAALLQLVPTSTGVQARERYFLRGNVLQNHHGGMVRVGDYIYGGHGHNLGLPFCLQMESGRFAWPPQRGPGDGSAAVVYADGMLYFRYENGVMALVEATPKGYNMKSAFALPRFVGTPSWPHPVVANGCLYIRGNDVLLCYDVKQR